jgi:dihydroxy-acid dehydratase
MAAARHNRPTIIVYGGTTQPGTRHLDCPSMGYQKGGTVNISDAFESFGGYCFLLCSTLSDIVESFRVFKEPMPSEKSTTNNVSTSFVMHVPDRGLAVGCTRKEPGCFGFSRFSHIPGSANTMSSALEVLGMSLPYSSSIPAVYPGPFYGSTFITSLELKLKEEKSQECFKAAKYLKKLLELDIKPRCVFII